MRLLTKLSKRQEVLRQMATEEAFKSPSNYKHGALITKGPIVYSRGYNNPRCKFLDICDCCQHAEMAVAAHFINSHVRPKEHKYRLLPGRRKKERL